MKIPEFLKKRSVREIILICCVVLAIGSTLFCVYLDEQLGSNALLAINIIQIFCFIFLIVAIVMFAINIGEHARMKHRFRKEYVQKKKEESKEKMK